MTIQSEEVKLVRTTVECDGCCKTIEDYAEVFCEPCRTLPDRHVEPREVADGLREWVRTKRPALTEMELELLEAVAGNIERGTRL